MVLLSNSTQTISSHFNFNFISYQFDKLSPPFSQFHGSLPYCLSLYAQAQYSSLINPSAQGTRTQHAQATTFTTFIYRVGGYSWSWLTSQIDTAKVINSTIGLSGLEIKINKWVRMEGSEWVSVLTCSLIYYNLYC